MSQGTASQYTKWVPFQLACRWDALQRGSLNVGNTQQNIANLLTLCRTNANTNGGNVPGGGGTYGRWSQGANRPVGSAQPTTALEVYAANVPGFQSPPEV